MSKLRQREAFQELAIAANQTHTQVETSVDLVKARWASLREHYAGVAAEDVESEVTTIVALTEQLLDKLTDWRDCCQLYQEKVVTDVHDSESQTEEVGEAVCSQDG
ncbi:hypothetical protein [Vibrio sp. 10N]|uniref:hypothetical protein n=1 Tax=Vibrio sp. 10N TaxID=3058938 RepID=UPI0028148AF0|nr:hypothetical protein VB10N_19220 [Vibrio sp. 10N]